MTTLVGRQSEQNSLRGAFESHEPELIAVYGRRRVGKTFLIRQFFGSAIVFELTGSHASDMSTQLRSFATALTRATRSPAPLAPAASWSDAFLQLESHLKSLPKRRQAKQVVFLDELPWLATRRSGFLEAFEHFWNSWASTRSNLVIVICGSSASWMLKKVVKQRGGLHNRVTRRIRLEPFALRETEEYLHSRNIKLDRYQIIELYMAFGGVPLYLSQIRPGQSAAQSIEQTCFTRDGLLQDEFLQLYTSLFEGAERHEVIVRALARKKRGLARNELLETINMPSGGTSTKVLNELEESGFIIRTPRLGQKQRDALYRLADEYSLFYLSWIEKQRSRSTDVWQKKRAGARFRAWSGLAYESVCLKHTSGIKRALGISGVESEEASWFHRPVGADDEGAQIDLVIDRADRSINLCEIKFSESEFVIDKSYARMLEQKRDIFRRVTGTKKTLFLTFVTTYGVSNNTHAQKLGIQNVTMDSLFVD